MNNSVNIINKIRREDLLYKYNDDNIFKYNNIYIYFRKYEKFKFHRKRWIFI